MRKKKIFKYISAFGLLRGIEIFYKIRYNKKNDLLELRIPKLKGRVFLRPFTSDIGVFEEIFIDLNYKCLTHTENCTTIIDAGANIGLCTLFLLTKYPKAVIYCIEPESSNFEILKQNTREYPNVHILKNGLWNSDSYLKIENTSVSHWAFQIIESSKEDSDIHGISIADLIKQHQLKTIDILKIDIEGSEKEVFETNNEWLSITRNLLVEIHEDMRSGAKASVINAINSHAFKQKNYNSNYFFYK